MFFSNQNAEIVACILSFQKSLHKPNLESNSKYVFPPIWRGKWRRSEHAHASYPGLSFRAHGFSPYIWGGKKGEFRDWTKCQVKEHDVDKALITNRKQRGLLNGVSPEAVIGFSGVPQGSFVGPCWFLVYINDRLDSITSNVRLFTDETIVHISRFILSWTRSSMKENLGHEFPPRIMRSQIRVGRKR